MIDETVRLYAREPRVPVDDVLPQHQAVHADLERWGAWNRERYQQGMCSSIEKRFDNRGAREVGKAIVTLPPDPKLRQIDTTVRHMALRVPEHAMAIKLYYADKRSPQTICRMLGIHWKDFGRWMGHARSMVMNIAREFPA